MNHGSLVYPSRDSGQEVEPDAWNRTQGPTPRFGGGPDSRGDGCLTHHSGVIVTGLVTAVEHRLGLGSAGRASSPPVPETWHWRRRASPCRPSISAISACSSWAASSPSVKSWAGCLSLVTRKVIVSPAATVTASGVKPKITLFPSAPASGSRSPGNPRPGRHRTADGAPWTTTQ